MVAVSGSETLRYDVVTTADTRGLKDSAREASAASRAARELSERLTTQTKTAQAASGATIALARSDRILADAEALLSVDTDELSRQLRDQQKAALEAAGATRIAADAARSGGGAFSALGTPMGAAAVAGIALSPVLVTVAAGLGGTGLAALGAAKDTKAMAQVLGPLKSEVASFQAALKPQTLGLFGQGAGIATTVLKGLQPVAAETEKALGGVLGQVDAEFRSKAWQDFFGFMRATAGPDVQLLGKLFVDLTSDLPPLLTQLQPVAEELLKTADAGAKVVGVTEQLVAREQQVATAAHQSSGIWGILGHAVQNAYEEMVPGTKALPLLGKSLNYVASQSDPAAKGVAAVGFHAALTSPKVATLAQQVNHLTDAYNASITPQLGYANALITQRNDADNLARALHGSRDQVGLATAAQRNSFSAANQFIQDLLNTSSAAQKSGRGIDAQISAIGQALPALQHVKGGTRDYWAEVQQLVGWLNRLRAEKKIAQTVTLFGNGSWAVPTQRSPSSGPGGGHQLAAGWLLSGGVPGKDSIPLLGMPGELMVPKHLVDAGAVDHLRGRIPGFAAGGVVGAYNGALKGLQPWAAANQAATVALITSSVASAMARQFAAVAAAAPSFGGPGSGALGGDAAANRALARSMFPWPASQWPSFDYLEMREAGYNRFARNPSSGAYGIPQALPESKLPFAGQSGGGSHAGAQLSWMFGYIGQRYGTPFNAALHERFNNWYGNGLDGVFSRPTVIGVGERGPEHVRVTPLTSGRGGAGGTVIVNVNVSAPIGSRAELENWFTDVCNSAARDGKRTWAFRHSPSAA
jgi:hypothetical protein